MQVLGYMHIVYSRAAKFKLSFDWDGTDWRQEPLSKIFIRLRLQTKSKRTNKALIRFKEWRNCKTLSVYASVNLHEQGRSNLSIMPRSLHNYSDADNNAQRPVSSSAFSEQLSANTATSEVFWTLLAVCRPWLQSRLFDFCITFNISHYANVQIPGSQQYAGVKGRSAWRMLTFLVNQGDGHALTCYYPIMWHREKTHHQASDVWSF